MVVQDTIDPEARIEFRENTADDPHKRKPDISRANELLGWEPKFPSMRVFPSWSSTSTNVSLGIRKNNLEAAGGF
jgi:UDP-glucuronate decarboxylase